jgi:Flp pilus assembly protein TadD
MKMLGRNRIYQSITTLLPAVLAGSLAYAAEAGAYEMVAYLDGPGSEALFDGRYADAVETARAARPKTSEAGLRASTNLCVAFTLSGDLRAADEMCSRALRLARRVDASSGDGIRRGEESGKARSNLGVLKALRGDKEGAAEDFRRSALISRWDGATRNLAELEASDVTLPRVARTAE